MVRKAKETKRARRSDHDINIAVEKVINREMSIREAAEEVGMTKSTLARAVMKKRKADKEGETILTYQPKHNHQQVFKDELEKMLMEYILTASKVHQGMTNTAVRRFAYEYAKHLELKYPSTWDKNEMAGGWSHKYFNVVICFSVNNCSAIRSSKLRLAKIL